MSGPMSDPRLFDQLPHTLASTDFPALGEKYAGKVRDTYRRGDRLVLITTDRLSAFDHVLTTLPFKGDLLNTLASSWFERTRHVVPNHVIDVIDPAVTVAKVATPLPIEFVVRGYLTGSLWRDYQAGADPYELRLPPGIRRDAAFPQPILTPSTKAPRGTHDEPISEAEVLRRGLVSPALWQEAREAALALFAEGQRVLAPRGLLLVDTKYELGVADGRLTLIDELHTPDSSRFWIAAEYAGRFERGEPQRMLDKENLRQWLITERGFSGQPPLPHIPDEVRVGLTEKYLQAFEAITGAPFPLAVGSTRSRVEASLRRARLL